MIASALRPFPQRSRPPPVLPGLRPRPPRPAGTVIEAALLAAGTIGLAGTLWVLLAAPALLAG